MSRISKIFETLRAKGKRAFIGYAMVGYPDLAVSQRLAEGLLKEGADLLEIGIPFSDPLADGPVIQKASERALELGTTLAQGLELAAKLRPTTGAGLLIMTYYNPVLSLGLVEFAARAKSSGVDGVIIPDLPPEEAGPFARLCRESGLDLVLLAAPTSTPARLKKIASQASGFIYFVSVTGVTGEHSAFDSQLGPSLARLRKLTDLPLAIGFGVSTPDKAREAAALADGVVAASAVLKPLGEGTGGTGMDKALGTARGLVKAVHEFGGAG
jgi:tryptophan synthase alpha chain